jgi:hypothetical protein
MSAIQAVTPLATDNRRAAREIAELPVCNKPEILDQIEKMIARASDEALWSLQFRNATPSIELAFYPALNS